jgi:hypothetical protein
VNKQIEQARQELVKAFLVLGFAAFMLFVVIPVLIWLVLIVPPERLNIPIYTVYVCWLLFLSLAGTTLLIVYLLRDDEPKQPPKKLPTIGRIS